MKWGPRADIIALLLASVGLSLAGLAVGLVAPIIVNIKQGHLGAIIPIVVLFTVICCAIYLLSRRKNKSKKPPGNQKQ